MTDGGNSASSELRFSWRRVIDDLDGIFKKLAQAKR